MNRARAIFTVIALAAAVALFGLEGGASAGDADDPVGRARMLFLLARDDLKAKRYAEARGKFSDSERLDPAPGTLLGIAFCDQQLGRTASAWAEYMQGAVGARAIGKVRWAEAAEKEANLLEPLLARVMIRVEERGQPDLPRLLLDGTLFPKSLWGTATPIDPGAHALLASASDRRPWSTQFTAEPSGVVTVTIPVLEPTELPAPLVVAPQHGPEQAPPERSSPESWAPRRVAAVVIGGAGIAAIATSAGLALLANSTYQGVQCDVVCSPEKMSQQSRAFTEAGLSTVSAVAGGAALASALMLWILSPNRGHTVDLEPVLGPSAAGLSWRRDW